MAIRWMPILWVAVAVMACGQDDPVPTSGVQQTAITATPVVAPGPTTSAPSIPTAAATPTVTGLLALLGVAGSSAQHHGTASLEEIILGADVIARVGYLSKRTSVAQVPATDWWSGLLEFRFRVHEYLKGSGANEIGAFVFLHFPTEAEARAAVAAMAAGHDNRWDSREAIVFLVSDAGHPVPEIGQDQYWFGEMVYAAMGVDPGDGYTVASPGQKLWLPEAGQSSTSTRQASSTDKKTEKRFMLDVPSGTGRARASTSSASGPTISLAGMKTRISTLEAEANTGGTPEYRRCVSLAYWRVRHMRYRVSVHGSPAFPWDVSMASGLPAGGIVFENPHTAGIAQDNIGRGWFEGPDKDVVRYENLNFRPTDEAGEIKYTQRIVTARPLAAGSYTFYHNWLSPWLQICNKNPPELHNQEAIYLTVTAPERTLHEAFFDPVDTATAVGADSSNGVLEPNAFSLDGTTTTISNLKWQDGEVTMTLSPTSTSLADYAIDFIDTTGTTTLSLTSGNASTTALTWTVPDKPWSDGDLLMLRIHKPLSNDATLSALALSGVDLTFDPATTTYAASVPATTTQTTVTPTTNHASATYVVKLAGVVDLDGTIPLAAGDNVITVEVTAEDTTTTQTYSVTITRATPPEPVTVTLTPRTEGLTFFDLTVQWNDPQTCDNRYFVTVRRNDGYIVRNMGFHPAETTSVTQVTYWPMDNVPDFVAVVECDPSSGPRREVGRMSLRSARN